MEAIIISPYSQKLRDDKIKTPNPKTYPYWEQLIKLLKEKNYNIIQVGVEGEEKINGVDEFFKNLPFKVLEEKVKECKTWISVDHFCAYHKKPGVVLFSQSDPNIYGHKINKNLLKDRKYLRPDQFGIWESCPYNIDAYISPEEVVKQSGL